MNIVSTTCFARQLYSAQVWISLKASHVYENAEEERLKIINPPEKTPDC